MKYELTLESKMVDNITLHRIRALKDFSNIKKGDLGGWIEKEGNLSQEGDCWIFENAEVCGNAAMVFENAQVRGYARVYDNAIVGGSAHVFGNARVYDYACVYGNAMVYGNARIYGNVEVRGNAVVRGDTDFDSGFIMESIGSVTAPVNINAPLKEVRKEEEIIRPKTISAIHWLDVCTE